MEHLAEPLAADPLPKFAQWLADARADGQLPNPDAMALATVDATGQPDTRIVLCKALLTPPGCVVFYTNYESAKAQAIENHAKVAAVFHWDHMNRQVRIEGIATRSPADESDAYFASRDRDSQVGAWASAQSQPIETRAQLLRALEAIKLRFADSETVPRPPHWGGYRVWLSAIELWTRGDARLHDRGRWERQLGGPSADGNFPPGEWSGIRLQP